MPPRRRRTTAKRAQRETAENPYHVLRGLTSNQDAHQDAVAALRRMQRSRSLGAAILTELIGVVTRLPHFGNQRHVAQCVIKDPGLTPSLMADAFRAWMTTPHTRYLAGYMARYPEVPVDLVLEVLTHCPAQSAATSATHHPRAVQDPRVRERLLQYHGTSSLILQRLVETANAEDAPVLLARFAERNPSRAARLVLKQPAAIVNPSTLAHLMTADDQALRTNVMMRLNDVTIVDDAEDTLTRSSAADRRRARKEQVAHLEQQREAALRTRRTRAR